MELTVAQIAGILGGEIKGDGERKVSKIETIQDATEGSISFLSNPKYEPYIYKTKASAVIVNNKIALKGDISTTLILVDDPYSSFSLILEEYERLTSLKRAGVEEPSFMADDATIGENHFRGAFSYIGKGVKIGNNVKIFPQVYIGENVTIGDNTILYPGIKIYAGCQVGSYCTIHAGAVIGSDGFGFAPQPDGSFKKIPQIGNVIIEDHVDIGANTTIDCGTLGATVIKKGAKLDNLIQIAHNVEIGENTALAALVGIAGSTKIGKNCIFGGQAGVIGHLQLADRTTIAAKSAVIKSVKEPGSSFSGSPAFEHKDYMRSTILFRKLPDLLKRIEELEEKVVNLPTT